MELENLFIDVLRDRANLTTVEKRTEAIFAIIRKIEEIENDNENTALPMYWGSIGSGLASAAVVLGSASLNPIAALLVSTLSVSSSVVAIGSAIFRHQIEAPRVELLTRYRLALMSKPANVWASLWAIAGTENFLIALERASSGAIADGQLVRGKSSINEAIDTCAQLVGVTAQEFTARLKSGIPYEIKQTVEEKPNVDELANSKTVNTNLKTAYSDHGADYDDPVRQKAIVSQLEKILASSHATIEIDDVDDVDDIEIDDVDARSHTIIVNPQLVNCIQAKIAESGTISFGTLRKYAQRRLADVAKIENIRDALGYLLERGIIRGNEKDGYTIN